jgi:hypothetical protein
MTTCIVEQLRAARYVGFLRQLALIHLLDATPGRVTAVQQVKRYALDA